MAHIRYGKNGMELDITPVSRWYEPGCEEPCIEYEIGLYYQDKPLFSEEVSEKLIALKDSQAVCLSSFVLQVLASGEGDSWIMLEPKVSFFFSPKIAVGCACRSEMPAQTPFCMEIKIDQNILAEHPFTDYSDTGLLIRIEASREKWGEFARQLEQEEVDFD